MSRWRPHISLGRARGPPRSYPAMPGDIGARYHPARWGGLVGGAGDKGGDYVRGVTVEGFLGPVAHRGPRVGVAGRLLRPVVHTQLLNSLGRPPSVARRLGVTECCQRHTIDWGSGATGGAMSESVGTVAAL